MRDKGCKYTEELLEKRRVETIARIKQAAKEKETMDENKPVLRAKLRVSEVLHQKDENGNTSQERVKLQAVYSSDPQSENAQWTKWTPNATFELWINNPNAFGKLSSGHEFFVDFTPVEGGPATEN